MRDLRELLHKHARDVEELLEREVPKGRRDYLTDGVWYQFDSGGKRLRPALCLMTCEALKGDVRAALPFALATEILHNFLLIHDDIEDGDTMRRDQQTLWARFGVPNALNVADYLIARAYRLILEAPLAGEVNLRLSRAFTHALERTVEGQALDINLRGHPEVDLETYYRIVQLKTAHYLALTWVGGAIVAGVAESDLGSFWELGRCLGPAFQIRDDIIDLTEGKGRGGEIGCDIREGKPSIFFAHVQDRRVGRQEDRRRLVEIFQRDRQDTTEEDIRWAIDFFREHGAIDFAQSEANRLVGEAEEILGRLPLGEEGSERFRSVARFIIDRNF
ncbi:MAG: polyprenyl synthetase family protein [Planctomycetota bacterium]|nr:polyprenyl synthetase family protein [Planctomycetota bacterium]